MHAELNANESFELFYSNVESLLNNMAPFKKQTKREQRLEQRPWITKGLLKLMNILDSLYKELSNENDPLTKRSISIKHKTYRN